MDKFKMVIFKNLVYITKDATAEHDKIYVM